MDNSNHGKSDAPGQNKEVTLIVNAKPKVWTGKSITFQEVVVLAFGVVDNTGSAAYTVSYKKGEDKKPEGVMTEGDSVHVKDQMIFNVTRTDKS